MRCPRCQQDNPVADAQFCPRCGSPVKSADETGPPTASYSDLLDQQTATGEILRIISSSPTDIQPVFDAIVRSAVRLCGGLFSIVLRFDGEFLHFVAHHNFSPEALNAYRRWFPQRATDDHLVGRVVAERRVMNVADVTAEFRFVPGQQEQGFHSVLFVPMVQGGICIGVIGVSRAEVGAFPASQVALLQAFADQAVIAIENARLFNETKEALEQQTATSEILGVISSSLIDTQPVFDTIARNALRLCEGSSAIVSRYDGELMHLAAHAHVTSEGVDHIVRTFPMRPSRTSMHGRAVLEGTVVHVRDVRADLEYDQRNSQALQNRSSLAVPMLRAGRPVGAIAIGRFEVRPFSEQQIALLQTFADQAVIAIENVRLFTELQTSNRGLTTALDHQTATSEILQVISRSPTDVQPVFDAIAKSALHLCDSSNSVVGRYDGELLHLAAHAQQTSGAAEALRGTFPMRPNRATASGRALLEGCVVHIPNAPADPEYAQPLAEVIRARAVLAVPMLRDGQPIGTIAVGRLESRPFSDKHIALLQTFADQAVIAIENVRLFKETKEALDRQTATSEILSVISTSPTDVQPVFDAIARHAVALCDGAGGMVVRYDGAVMRLAAYHNVSTIARELHATEYPRPPDRTVPLGAAIVDRTIVHVPNLQTSTRFAGSPVQRSGRASMIAVPLLRHGEAIGAIGITRDKPQGFSDRDIALLQTFADQAVIAIENVRLFTELQEKNRAVTKAHAQVSEALDQQTATSEILRVISSSPMDVQPVFDTIAERALRLCDAKLCTVFRFDGKLIHLVALDQVSMGGAAAYRDAYPAPPGRGGGTHRAILTGSIVHIPDIRDDPEYELHDLARANDFGCVLSVPMLRDRHPIGAITVGREAARPFADEQIELLKTFADQALIAIENVRLFTELQEKNQALTQAHAQVTEALEQQTATSEILRVISSSPTDIQPVVDSIAAKALDLCKAKTAAVFRFDGELIHVVAAHSFSSEAVEAHRQTYPIPPGRGGTTARAILSRAVVYIPDIREDSEYEHQALAKATDYLSALSVPMLHESEPVGAITVTRAEAGAFSQRQIELLKTFADQAVIAIENVRLFKELETRNRDLTEALDRQTATAEILRVISQSQTEVQPVFDAIVDHAMRLFRAWAASIVQLDGQLLHLIAVRGGRPGLDQYLREQSPWSIDGTAPVARCIVQRTVVHVPDTELDHDADEAIREIRRRGGMRSILAAPMLRDGQPIGGIWISRVEAGPFSPAEIALLQTFADQAVIAIENARLLSELQARTQELTRSVEQLTALGDVGRAVSSSLDLDTVLTTIVGRAIQLSGTDGGTIFEYVEATEEFVARATLNADEGQSALLRSTRLRRGEGAVGQMAVTREPFQILDIAAEGAYESRLRGAMLAAGTRSVLAIPLLHEDRLVGGLVVTRNTPGEFTTAVVEMLRTFASQSALAIQNARLFREIEEKSRQLEVASQHKSEFLANMSHELRTPLNAIIGFSEVLTDRMFGELNEKQDEYLKDIYASGTHLLSLINDILDLSKIEAGRMELELSDFHLPTALDSALTLVRERAGRRNMTLQMSIDEGLGEIQGDERKIRQVVLNLLSNAIKFTPEGGRIEIAAVPKDGSVEVSVSDTGIGIAPEDQEKVFEEFRQVGTADKKAEGTGLGLTLCRKFIELHRGKIWVKSQVGVGSTFTFTIPVRQGV